MMLMDRMFVRPVRHIRHEFLPNRLKLHGRLPERGGDRQTLLCAKGARPYFANAWPSIAANNTNM